MTWKIYEALCQPLLPPPTVTFRRAEKAPATVTATVTVTATLGRHAPCRISGASSVRNWVQVERKYAHSQVQGLKAGRFQARVEFVAPLHLDPRIEELKALWLFPRFVEDHDAKLIKPGAPGSSSWKSKFLKTRSLLKAAKQHVS